MSVEEISIIIEATLGAGHDTISKVFYGNKVYYGFFSPADDYDLLKRTNRWRFTPNESSQTYNESSGKDDGMKKLSLILNGDSITRIEVKTISVPK